MRIKLKMAVVAGVWLAVAGARAMAQTHPNQPEGAIKIGERKKIHSYILKEDRPYLVSLPAAYDDKSFAPERYPVLYLLDGDWHFPWASAMTQYMTGNRRIPGLIIVAIPNTDRTRDLTPTHTLKGDDGKESKELATSGGAESFLKFLQEELMPRIDRDYRTQPYRILAGHSLGGLFVLHTVIHHPQVFQADIAIDPSLWWDNRVMLREIRAAPTNDLRGLVYISLANSPPDNVGETNIMKAPCQEFAQWLAARNSARFQSRLQYFEDEEHGSVPLPSLYYGLRFIFDGYKPLPTVRTLAGMKEHYAKVSARLGMTVAPPEKVVNVAGWMALNMDHATNAAFELLQFNAATYPESPNVYTSLGNLSEKTGDKASAVRYYETALKVNPENEFATKRLREMKAGGAGR
jgi:uncharacterized protein